MSSRLSSSKIVMALWAASIIALAGCDDLPRSALEGYRGAYAPNAAADRLQGSWSTPCTGSSPAVRDTLLFFGRQLSVIRLWFDGASDAQKCMTTSGHTGPTQQYSLTIGQSFELPGDASATTQTLSTTVRLTQFSVAQGYASSANAASVCGRSDWTDTTSVDVKGATCLGVSVPSPSDKRTYTVVFTGADSLTFDGVVYTKDP